MVLLVIATEHIYKAFIQNKKPMRSKYLMKGAIAEFWKKHYEFD